MYDVQQAISMVEDMRRNGIPAWLVGGIAHDLITGKNYPHKDIDILISDVKYKNKVKNYFLSRGWKITRNWPKSQRFEYGDLEVDVLYEEYPIGKEKPPLDINSYTVPVKYLIDAYTELIESYRAKINFFNDNIKKHKEMIKNLRWYI